MAAVVLAASAVARVSALGSPSVRPVAAAEVPPVAQVPLPMPDPRPEPMPAAAHAPASRVAVTSLTVGSRVPAGVWAAIASPASASLDLPSGVVLTVRVGRRAPVTVATNAPTVALLLSALHVRLGPLDQVAPALGARPAPGTLVQVTRIRRSLERVQELVPFGTVYRTWDFLSLGTERVMRRGTTGVRVDLYVVTYRNGAPVARSLAAGWTIVRPLPELVVRAAGPWTVRGTRVGPVSWYDLGCTGLTAASPSLPYGTRVTVTNPANGRQVTVVIDDRGPWGDGRILDLCQPAFAQIAPLGQGVISAARLSW